MLLKASFYSVATVKLKQKAKIHLTKINKMQIKNDRQTFKGTIASQHIACRVLQTRAAYQRKLRIM